VIHVEDADGDEIDLPDNSVIINVENDVPINFSPQPLTDTDGSTPTTEDDAIVNDGNGYETNPLHDTNNDGTGEPFIGADGFGSLTFTTTGHTNGEQLKDTDGNPVTTADGKAIYMVGYGTSTLTGYIESGATPGYQPLQDTAVALTVTLDETTGTYTIDFNVPLDDGSGTSFDDFTGSPAGQNDWIGVDADKLQLDNDAPLDGIDIDDPNDPNPNSTDLLITPYNGVGTINTDSNDIGNGAQWIDGGKGIRLDFVTNVGRDGTMDEDDPTGYEFTGHDTVTDAGFTIMQTKGNGDASVQIRAVYDDDSGTLKTLDGSTVDIDPNSIVITGDDDGLWQIHPQADGSVVITGLSAGAQITFQTVNDEPFNAVEIVNVNSETNPATNQDWGGADFVVGEFGFTTVTEGSNIDLSFDVTAEDADGDTSTGQIDVTLVPVGSSSATSTTTLAADPPATTQSQSTDMSATLVASNDNGDNARVFVAGNQAALMGVIAAAGIDVSATIAAVRAMVEDVRGDAENASGGQHAAMVSVEADGGSSAPTLAAREASDSAVSQEAEARASNAAAEVDRAKLDAANDEAGPTVSALADGTEASGAAESSAVTAAAVAMPSIEMVAALEAANQSVAASEAASVAHNQEVGRVLADALAGGNGLDIGALVDSIGGGTGHAVREALASLKDGGVSNGHNDGGWAFANGHDALSIDALALHHDAPPAA
jgi:hypothetical protein